MDGSSPRFPDADGGNTGDSPFPVGTDCMAPLTARYYHARRKRESGWVSAPKKKWLHALHPPSIGLNGGGGGGGGEVGGGGGGDGKCGGGRGMMAFVVHVCEEEGEEGREEGGGCRRGGEPSPPPPSSPQVLKKVYLLLLLLLFLLLLLLLLLFRSKAEFFLDRREGCCLLPIVRAHRWHTHTREVLGLTWYMMLFWHACNVII